MNKWDRPEYQRITRAEACGDEVAVMFEDGSRVVLKAEQIAPEQVSDVNWSALTYNPFEIVVPAAGDRKLEVPWSTIRALTDRDFGAHLAQAAEEEARQIGLRLKGLREARGISGKGLAERAGITPQSLSRIENGRHDVTFTTLRRVLAAMGCSLKDLARPGPAVTTLQSLMRVLKPLGFSKRFVLTHLVPRASLRELRAGNEESTVRATAEVLSAIYGWPLPSILEGRRLIFNADPLKGVLFKRPSRARDVQAVAYTLYAHWLAAQAIQATPHLKPAKLSEGPLEIRKEIEGKYGDLNFRALLSYTWDKGFVVLPLGDEGVFHGACWRVADRIAIVIKQRTRSQARWMFDLAHELAHAILHISETRATILEPEEISHFPQGHDEAEASDFAQDLIFNGKAEYLAQQCVREARGNLRMLKRAVVWVARENRVPPDALANYMAHRLSMQNQNWWGTANNMQIVTPSPLEVAREEFKTRVQPVKINPEERSILMRALEGEE